MHFRHFRHVFLVWRASERIADGSNEPLSNTVSSEMVKNRYYLVFCTYRYAAVDVRSVAPIWHACGGIQLNMHLFLRTIHICCMPFVHVAADAQHFDL